MVGCGYVVLFVCVLGGWLDDSVVCVVSNISSCEIVSATWGLSSFARSEDFGFCYLDVWMRVDVWFGYRVWNIWEWVWMRKLSF